MSYRESLAQYVGQRLYMTGVLIDLIEPSKKNNHTYELVFASIHLPHNHLRFDHIVISVSEAFYYHMKPELYKKYGFTAKVCSYVKSKRLLNMTVNTEAYHFRDINSYKWSEVPRNKTKTLGPFLERNISMVLMETKEHTKESLIDELTSIIEGDREQRIQSMLKELRQSKTSQKKRITKKEVIKTLYTDSKRHEKIK